eukprot:3332751-Amphidinium_carterae.2
MPLWLKPKGTRIAHWESGVRQLCLLPIIDLCQGSPFSLTAGAMEKCDPEGTYRDRNGRLRNGRLRNIRSKQFRTDPNKSPSISRHSRGGRSASATPREEDEQERSRSGDEYRDTPLITLPNSVANAGEKRTRLPKKTRVLKPTGEEVAAQRQVMEDQIRQGIVTIPINSAQGIPGKAIDPLALPGIAAQRDQSVNESSKLPTSKEVMSPNSLGALRWSITSHPPTPRDEGNDGENTPLPTDYEEAFDSVCCQCGEMMSPDDTVCCCRCDHRCHYLCRHFCDNDEIVCIHCKRSHFLPGQPYIPPMSHSDLVRNVEYGVSVTSGSKIRNLEERRLEVLQSLAQDGLGEEGPPGSRAGGSKEVIRNLFL